MQRPLTIFHLVSLMGIGGRCATALRQMRLLSARGHRVLLGCLPGSVAAQRGREMGLTVFDDFHFRRGLHPLSFWSDYKRLASRCDTESVNVVHAHLSQETWVAAAAVRAAAGRPAFVRSRGVVVPIKPHLMNRILHNRLSQRVIAPSGVIYNHLRGLPGFDPERVTLIADGVDIDRFNPALDGTAIRDEFKIPPEAPLVLMVARLERVKGHEYFFKALATLLAQNRVPGLRAICACDERTPGMFEKTIAQAREFGVSEETLKFTGMRKDIEKFYAAADVVALPSLGSEGSSRVALESAASAVPIVATTVGCLPEVVQDGVTGRLVPPADPVKLADFLANLLADPAGAQAMGRQARERAVKLYDEKLMIERLEQVYYEALPKSLIHEPGR